LPDRAIQQYLPLDLAGPVNAFLDHWHPDVAVMVESEFWPRLIHQTHKRGIPLVLANARISDRSAARWGRMHGLAQALLGRFTLMTVPDLAMAAKLLALGAAPARVALLGSLKRGADRLPVDPHAFETLRAAFAGRPLWLAASTHPGEEGTVAAAHGLIRAALPGAILILAPRHPTRAAAVRAELEAAGLSVAQRSLGEEPGRSDVYLADTLGEMGLWLDLAPIAFIGGSLVAVGGHNAYEPALHGAAILHGPDVSNFSDLYQRLDKAVAALTVVDARTMAKAILDLQDTAARARLTAAATTVLAEEGDAITSTAGAILSLLPRQA
jgi:3-deoxy-D-manno-octulosonic-acid transferase